MVCRATLRVDRTMNMTIRIATLIARVALRTVWILVRSVRSRTKRILFLKNRCHLRIDRATALGVPWEVLEVASARVFDPRLVVSRKRLCRRFWGETQWVAWNNQPRGCSWCYVRRSSYKLWGKRKKNEKKKIGLHISKYCVEYIHVEKMQMIRLWCCICYIG